MDNRSIMGRRLAPFAALALLVLASTSSIAQTVDPALSWGTDGTVSALAHTNTTLFVGGRFGWAGRITGRFAPLDATTGLPVAGLAAVDGPVYAVESDGAGGWFLAGTFQRVRGEYHQFLAHLLADGSVSSWTPNAGGPVYALAR